MTNVVRMVDDMEENIFDRMMTKAKTAQGKENPSNLKRRKMKRKVEGDNDVRRRGKGKILHVDLDTSNKILKYFVTEGKGEPGQKGDSDRVDRVDRGKRKEGDKPEVRVGGPQCSSTKELKRTGS